MAQSPSHKFGQIIGEVLEQAIEPILRKFAQEHGLYLDKQGKRLARSGKKVTWTDSYGNKHDLDFVLEKIGSEKELGAPVAFIESAWRRYTKHSRNKAQEIQGAILPLAHTYKNNAPFKGVVLGGIFTKGALQQLKSLGFEILYFEYDTIVGAFRALGIDAHFEEDTSEQEFSKKVAQWDSLSDIQKKNIYSELIRLNIENVDKFINALLKTVVRNINTIRILPLHGKIFEYMSSEEAIKFINDYNEEQANGEIVRYEVQIKYNNGDEVTGEFKEKATAIDFLSAYKVN